MPIAIINPELRHLSPFENRMTHKQALAFKSRYFDKRDHGLPTHADGEAIVCMIDAAQRTFNPVRLVVPCQQLPY